MQGDTSTALRHPYLDAVVRESLRLDSGFPHTVRQLRAPMELLGYRLPAGTEVAPSMYLAHRSPTAYSDPLAFRPERFPAENPRPGAWFPFGGGARRCVGMTSAMQQIKIVLALVLKRARLSFASRRPVVPVRRHLMLVPSGGVPVVLRARSARA